MEKELAQALNEYLCSLEEDRATVTDFLTRYPQHALTLRSLLDTVDQVRHVPSPVSEPAAFAAGKRRMLQALEEKKRRQKAPSGLLVRLAESAGLRGGGAQSVVQSRALVFRLAAAGIAVLLLAFAGAALQSWLGASVSQVATLAYVSGEVEILPSGGDVWQPAEAGAQMEAGDRIRTGSSGAAELAFFDGSRTSLESETEITIARMSGRRGGGSRVIVLHQWVGQAYHRVQPFSDSTSRFEVETPTAVAAVRGTAFVTDVSSEGTTQVVVVEGLVNVKAEGVVVPVQAGYETVAHPEQPPAPVRPATISPSPPGLTKTPQPPGLTKTPQPPGQTKTPQPPGQTKTPQPPGLTKTPQPGESPEPTKELKPTDEPKPTKEPKPTDEPKPTKELKPTDEPKPTKEPKPTDEPPKPTDEPKPTKEPKPTDEPKPTKEAKPTKLPDDDDVSARSGALLFAAMVAVPSVPSAFLVITVRRYSLSAWPAARDRLDAMATVETDRRSGRRRAQSPH
jgi:hypothetical protein